MPVTTDLLTAIRMSVVANQRRFRLRPSPVWAFPANIERTYVMDLKRIVNEVERITNLTVLPYLSSLEAEANLNKPASAVRQDAIGDNVDELLTTLRFSIQNEVPTGKAAAMDVGQQTADWNDKQWQLVLRKTMGIDLFSAEPWLASQLELFTTANVSLIRSLKDQPLERIEGVILRGLQQGQRSETMAKEIGRQFDIARNRAKFIARDQVAKLNGQLTELRQTSLGVEEYIWHDSDDSRVRPTHAAHDGKTYKWAEPPTGTGHPGQDYNCRCWAEPVLDKLIESELKQYGEVAGKEAAERMASRFSPASAVVAGGAVRR